jgi:aminoglycoside phosphotransferase (APT) family kinase protein
VAYHVKLASEEDDLRELRRWRRLGDRLAEHYGAPSMAGWVDLPTQGLEGPVLCWVEGVTPAALEASLRSAAIDTVSALHADESLAGLLEQDGDVGYSCAEAYRSTYHRRFVADLDAVAAAPPPFVTHERLVWMEAEALQLLRRVENARAFDVPADRPTHHDLWLNNLISQPDGRLRILDWDGLALGDPMLDWATLFGPAPGSFRVAEPADLRPGAFSSAERERLRLLARASLLDWVIDSLADWLEVPASPRMGELRDKKRAAHMGALASYLARGWD